MAACLRGGCRAPLEADAKDDGSVAPAAPVVFVSDAAPPATAPVKNKLRSALQRSATPGLIADVYKFGRTLGA
jgi:hypothetical protein